MAIALKTRAMKKVTFADVDEGRMEIAEGFDFDAIASGSAELETPHYGVDLAVDATGVPAVAGRLIDYMANGGKGLFFGVCPSDARWLALTEPQYPGSTRNNRCLRVWN